MRRTSGGAARQAASPASRAAFEFVRAASTKARAEGLQAVVSGARVPLPVSFARAIAVSEAKSTPCRISIHIVQGASGQKGVVRQLHNASEGVRSSPARWEVKVSTP